MIGIIDKATEPVVVNLPNRTIELDTLLINKHVTLSGCPGSQILLRKNSIVIEKESLIITETIIVSDTTRSVFEIHPGTQLKLLDCAIKTKPKYTQQAVCIHIWSSKDSRTGSAKIINTSFKGYFTHILCGRRSSVIIEECNFSSCNNSSILTINADHLSIKDSVFTDCEESNIEIRFTEPSSTDTKREVVICGNTLSNSKGNGIIICANEVSGTIVSNTSISIDKNILSLLKKDGIVLQNIDFHKEIFITSNEVKNCGKNGIAVINSYPEKILISKNAVTKCKGAGVYICKAVCEVSNCEILQNENCGIILKEIDIVLTDPKAHQITIHDSEIKNNKEDGIAIYSSKNLLALLENNNIEGNRKNGLRIDTNVVEGNTSDKCENVYKNAERKLKETGNITVKNGKIVFNKNGGILIKNSYLTLDYPTIQGNTHTALDIKGSYKKIKLTNKTLIHHKIVGKTILNGENIDIYKRKKICCTGCRII